MYLDTKISLVCSHYNSFYIKTTEFSTCVWSLTHLSAVIADTFQDDSRLCSSTADQTLHLWPRKHWKPPQTPQEQRTGRQMLFYVKLFLSFALRSFFWPLSSPVNASLQTASSPSPCSVIWGVKVQSSQVWHMFITQRDRWK